MFTVTAALMRLTARSMQQSPNWAWRHNSRPPLHPFGTGFLTACLLVMHVLITATESAISQPLQTLPGATDVPLAFAPDSFYNPSLVTYGNQVICAIKHTQHKKIQHKIWWFNLIQLCNGSVTNLQSQTCRPYMPWISKKLDECELGSRVREGKVDSSGIGDTKLWVWPGKGVYAIFGHKPSRKTDPITGVTERYCNTQLVYHQYITQVWSDPSQSPSDPWYLQGRDPLPLLPDPAHHTYQATLPYVQEKNWMPWVYKDPDSKTERVMVTYMVMPHTVWEILPSGAAIPRWTTPSPELSSKFAKYDVHGGPPVVWVPSHLSHTGEGYYLGVMHHIEKWQRYRLYRHFAFKFRGTPPFDVTAISDELPLVFNSTRKGRMSKVTFAAGLYLDTQSAVIHLTYGAADVQARILTMSMEALESWFTGNVAFRRADPTTTITTTSSSSSSSSSSTRTTSTSEMVISSRSASRSRGSGLKGRRPVAG